MRRRAALVAALAMLTAMTPAHAQRRGPGMRPYANPSAAIAAEIAFNQAAQAKGQWTAFREFAAKDAVMYVPQRVLARDWLKGKADPQVAVKWQPFEVWSSCDGSYAVTRGAWQRPGSVGVFTTIWQRQPKNGIYRWVLDLGDTLAKPLDPPEMISAKVAECRARGVPGSGPPPGGDRRDKPKKNALPPIDPADAHSEDDTLRWKATIDARGAGSLVIERWNGTAYEQALRTDLAPQG